VHRVWYQESGSVALRVELPRQPKRAGLGAKAITAPAHKTEDLARFEEMYCAPTVRPA